MDYCGAAFDWRCEGLLDGYAAIYRATKNADYLNRIEQDLRAICSAQLLNGSFCNSWFDLNPYEGGMPYEPAMLAAACRARALLVEAGRPIPDGLDQTLELFVETRLLNELWSRLLHTFNDWLQSNFEYYTPHAVAASIELLIDYTELRGDWNRLEHYIIGAADSLLAVQCMGGIFDGGIPLSNRSGSAFSPTTAARCIPSLVKTAQKTGQEKYRQAALRLTDFVRRHALPQGGHVFLLFNGKPQQQTPLFIGAAADVANAFARAELLVPEDTQHLEKLLAGKQMATGAFRTACGFGNPAGRPREPDWRDLLPCCGWQDKIYSYLARQHSGQLGSFSPEEIRHPVLVRGRRGEYIETARSMRLLNHAGKIVYHWDKGSKWASINHL
jgi:hypothetical protein